MSETGVPTVPEPPTAYCTLEQVAARLRIDLAADPPDPDVEWLTLCWEYACQQLDVYFIDRPLIGPPWPRGVVTACIGVSVLAFRGKDAMSDVSEEFTELAPVRVPRVPLDAYEGWLYGFRTGASWSPA